MLKLARNQTYLFTSDNLAKITIPGIGVAENVYRFDLTRDGGTNGIIYTLEKVYMEYSFTSAVLEKEIEQYRGKLRVNP